VSVNDSCASSTATGTSFTDGDLQAPTETREDSRSLTLFLKLLANDIRNHPEKLLAADSGLIERIKLLVLDVDGDLDTPLLESDE